MEEKITARPRGTDSAEVIQVIKTTALSGSGTANDPCTIRVQYWSLDGQLLADGLPDLQFPYFNTPEEVKTWQGKKSSTGTILKS